MRETQCFVFIDAIEGAGTFGAQLGIQDVDSLGWVRLTTTANATSGAGHNLNNMELFFAFADFVKKYLGIGQAIGNAYTQLLFTHLNGTFTQTFDGTHLLKLDLRGGTSRDDFRGRTQSGFHHTTRTAKDIGGTC